MTLDVQFNLKKNPLYLSYLRENSHWYKYLNRDPNLFKRFEEEVKTAYKLRPTDKINRIFEAIDTIEAVISSLK